MDRSPQSDSTRFIDQDYQDYLGLVSNGYFRDHDFYQDYQMFLSNREVPFEEELEDDGVEEGGVTNTGDEEMDDPVVESISVTLTDPKVFDCPICFEPLYSPVFQFALEFVG
ncbi:hypothetical protein Patl1_02981 [Pistacia atlantica]|uniref:Uncharacterized protein n=1 Tax=Pistacia atlantica TaxID=434234 RepID=A0ACC1CAH2_9ROSI|nr:hypothetical protein Patl1_02981 [Pistacia atlantica]